MTLKIAPGFTLPLDVAGEAIAILGKRGSGKTNTATVLVEELMGAGVQVVIVDPVKAWWGLRSSYDGEGPGLEIPILGGPKGDVPLEETAGALIADVAVDSGQSLLLDLSDLPTKAAIGRFVTDFAERLYRSKGRAEASVLHVVLEEADMFAPQRVKGSERMQGAIEQIVRRGRSRGLGVTMITQRSAVLSKDVLTQADMLIVMRTTGPHDLRAIREWIDSRGDERGVGVLESLPGLATGEGWVWNPENDLLDRAQFRRRETYDSSRTPRAGEKRVAPEHAATIDLASLGEQIAATVEKVKADDPKELRKQITALRRELEQRPEWEVTETIEIEKVVEVPMLDGQIPELEQAVNAARDYANALDEHTHAILAKADAIIGAILEHRREPREPARATARRPDPGHQPAPRPTGAPARPAATRPEREADAGDDRIGKGERKVLDVLAEFPNGRTQNELAFLAGYSANASTIGVILSKLRRLGLVEHGQPIRPTAEGLDAVGGLVERPTGQALLDTWLRHPRMGEGERRVLLALIDLYPSVPSTDELAELTGYSPTASTLGVILSKLRKLGLVERGQRRVPAEFMESIQE